MPVIEIRPFQRSDREQLTALVNAHAAAVVPGATVSVNAVLSQLEREPGEYVVDPWVVERTTLVAEQERRIVAAAHLHRYGFGADVGEAYRDAGLIRWLVWWPEAPPASPYQHDCSEAAARLLRACIGRFERWGVDRQYAGGALPVPGVYGVPAQWPHVRAAYEAAGFRPGGRIEIVYLALVAELARPEPPLPGLTAERTVGVNGTRISARLDGRRIGLIEVSALDEPSRHPRNGGLADVGNLHVEEAYRRRGVATWLLGRAAAWLELGGVERLLDYATPDETASAAFLAKAGFTELTRTERGWTRPTGAVSPG